MLIESIKLQKEWLKFEKGHILKQSVATAFKNNLDVIPEYNECQLSFRHEAPLRFSHNELEIHVFRCKEKEGIQIEQFYKK